ncbi:hypothetical protein [Larkinella soli]|uniref:hypothetical protein n=1 Tax=Larkinella soli TaxID=1770527 RepID=UPI000FFB7D28|nr:hypothetical protein [Larkinella soli]
MKAKSCLTLLLLAFACKDTGGVPNRPPASLTLKAVLTSVDPYTYRFEAAAVDADFDPLTYRWEFGEGTVRAGADKETFVFREINRPYTVRVSVTDGKSEPVSETVIVQTAVGQVTVDLSKKNQTIEGFGGFGAQDVYWSNGPLTSEAFVDAVVNDLGLTILRDEIPTSFEPENDNTDPNVTDLSKYNLTRDLPNHHAHFGRRIPHLKAMKAAGVEKFIISVWSPPEWMKWNNRLDNGTKDNSAPAYNPNPNAGSNQLKKENYEEFAEYCTAFVRIFKREIGVEPYGLSLQNEPRFSQFYQSCVYNGEALRDLIKTVGGRFRKEGITTRLFLPEDVGWLDGVRSMTQPTLNDPEARQYVGFVAVHGYALDGVTAGSQDAQTWQTMYNWGAPYRLPLWQTETSGYSNDMKGAVRLASAMYTALRFGNSSAWLFWTLSTGTLDEYSLMNSAGVKSKRFYTSKQFYRYIRPGAVRNEADSDLSEVLPLAFSHPETGQKTLVLINTGDTDRAVRITGTGLPAQWKQFRTTSDDDCAAKEAFSPGKTLLLPAASIITLTGN